MADFSEKMSEARYRSLCESTDKGFCTIKVVFDEHGKPINYVFLGANPLFEKETGIAEPRGKHMRGIAPDHEDHWFDLYRSVALTGESRWFEYPAVELNRWYKGYASRFRESNDHKIGVIFNNISERKRIEEALREREARLQQLADSIPQIVWTAGPDGKIDYCNERWYEYTGFPRGQVDQGCWESILHPDEIDRCVSTYSGCIESGQPYQIEYRFKDRFTGGYRWFMGRALPIRNECGEIVRWYGTCTDINDIKQAEAALRKREEELRNLTGQLQHRVAEGTQELVDSHVQLRALMTELNLTEQRERKRFATELHDHLQQLLVLGKLKIGQGKRLGETVPACAETMKEIDDVLTEALAYTRTLVAELSPPVLREHGFTASLKWLSTFMKRYGMDIAVTVPEPDRPDLSEDQSILLFQSVRELLINASKYAGGRQAWVTLQTTRKQLCIIVRDKGKGFAPLSMPTGSATSALSSKFGLYSIRERMKTLGGSFEIDSAPGKGTTVTLTLPLNEV